MRRRCGSIIHVYRYTLRVVVWGMLVLTSTQAIALDEAVPLPADAEFVEATPRLLYFVEEDDASVTLEQAIARFSGGDVLQPDKRQLSLGTQNAVVWARVRMNNPTGQDDFVLEVNNPRLAFVDFYIGDDARHVEVVQLGAARPPESRLYRHVSPAIALQVPPGADKTVYIRVANTGDMRFSVRLWTRTEFWMSAIEKNQMVLIMIGMLTALFLSQLVVFVSLRERGYFYLSLFLLSWLFCYLAITGYGSLLVWSHASLIGERAPTIGAYLMCAAFLLFANGLLDTRRYSINLSRLALAIAGVCLFGTVFTLVFDSIWRIYLNFVMVFVTPVIAIAMGVEAHRKGNRSAWLFLVSWCFMHLAAMFLLVLRAYLLTDHWLGAGLVNVLMVGGVLVWSLDLTGRVRARMRQKQQALEAEVQERTSALQEAENKLNDLSSLLPICANCKNIRDDQGYWKSVESYIAAHLETNVTHGLCPTCLEELYPDLAPAIDTDRKCDG